MIPPGFTSVDGELAVAGRRVSHWIAQAGGTPLFLYDRTIVAARIARLRAALPDVDLHYAIKANPMPALVAWIAGQVKKEGGRKAVVIPPLDLTYEGDTLHLR